MSNWTVDHHYKREWGSGECVKIIHNTEKERHKILRGNPNPKKITGRRRIHYNPVVQDLQRLYARIFVLGFFCKKKKEFPFLLEENVYLYLI